MYRIHTLYLRGVIMVDIVHIILDFMVCNQCQVLKGSVVEQIEEGSQWGNQPVHVHLNYAYLHVYGGCADWLSRDCRRNNSTASFYVGLRAEDGATRQALAVSTVCRWTLRDDCLQGLFGIFLGRLIRVSLIKPVSIVCPSVHIKISSISIKFGR